MPTPRHLVINLLYPLIFADALNQAKAGDDAMGTQRLVDVKSSELTPTLSLSSSLQI